MDIPRSATFKMRARMTVLVVPLTALVQVTKILVPLAKRAAEGRTVAGAVMPVGLRFIWKGEPINRQSVSKDCP